jgi:hypothetical protein
MIETATGLKLLSWLIKLQPVAQLAESANSVV